MSLDHRYFSRVTLKHHNGAVLESFKSIHARSTMVLFSRKSHTPLAAITLKSAKDIGCLSMLTGRPSPKRSNKPHFQGMLSMPDQSFNFVITNISDVGMINFNVLHTPHSVSEVDPGPTYGVNEVNELHANQSYEIEADQRTNRAMILKGKTEKKVDPITKQSMIVPLTVNESESSKDKAKEGLYFYLSVVPDHASTTLVKKFKEGTTWKAVPGFVRKTRPSPPPRHYHFPQGSPASFVSLRTTSDSMRGASGFSMPSMSMPSFRTSLLARRAPEFTPSRSQGSAIAASPCMIPRPSPAASWATKRSMYQATGEGRSQKGSDVAAALLGCVDVGNTQAGELTYGENINVYSNSTGHEYAYEYASEPTVLCMSIWEDMKFVPLQDTVEKMLEAELNEWIDNEGTDLIKSLNAVFKEDKCVIDLESEADTIVCTCGHQCINHANVTINLTRCPLCRSPITAFVRADGVVF